MQHEIFLALAGCPGSTFTVSRESGLFEVSCTSLLVCACLCLSATLESEGDAHERFSIFGEGCGVGSRPHNSARERWSGLGNCWSIFISHDNYYDELELETAPSDPICDVWSSYKRGIVSWYFSRGCSSQSVSLALSSPKKFSPSLCLLFSIHIKGFPPKLIELFLPQEVIAIYYFLSLRLCLLTSLF